MCYGYGGDDDATNTMTTMTRTVAMVTTTSAVTTTTMTTGSTMRQTMMVTMMMLTMMMVMVVIMVMMEYDGQSQRRRLPTHVRWHGDGHGHGHERAGQYNDNGAVQGGVYTLYIASHTSEQFAVPGVPSRDAAPIPRIHDIVILLSKNRGPCVVHMFAYLANTGPWLCARLQCIASVCS